MASSGGKVLLSEGGPQPSSRQGEGPGPHPQPGPPGALASPCDVELGCRRDWGCPAG